jgi:hypothetical protein
MGKYRLNSQKTTGIEITEKMKLERTNWLDMDLLPPARSVMMGVPVIGGMALSRMNIRAMLYSGLIRSSSPRKTAGKTMFFITRNLIISV